MENQKQQWILQGYEMFALLGPKGLKIEPLAKKVGKNKSSFYHFFADMDIFLDEVMEYHLHQSSIMAQKEQKARSIDPELISILVEHKLDLLFSRQLRFFRNIPAYGQCLEKSNAIVGPSFVMIWVKDVGILLTPQQWEAVFDLALENFYLQINPENLTYKWLKDYFERLKSILQRMALPLVDGSV